MDRAIEILEAKRNAWRERVEYHRRQSMIYHADEDYDKRDEEQQLSKLAIDNIHGLDYAISLLKGAK